MKGSALFQLHLIYNHVHLTWQVLWQIKSLGARINWALHSQIIVYQLIIFIQTIYLTISIRDGIDVSQSHLPYPKWGVFQISDLIFLQRAYGQVQLHLSFLRLS